MSLQSTGQADEETLLNLLRRAHHAEVFRTLARDVEGRITVEQVADDLSALADCVLKITSRWLWQQFKQRHRDEPLFAILAYSSFYIHTLLLLSWVTLSIWNGANFYMEYFSRRYESSLRALEVFETSLPQGSVAS
jgi:hypothetical protein